MSTEAKVIKCTRCNHSITSDNWMVKPVDNGPHARKALCPGCGLFLKWLPKEDDDPTKYKRVSKHRKLVKQYGRGFCELCLIKEKCLPNGSTLEGHHVIEYQHLPEDKPEPHPRDVWILCTSCHSLVNWNRTHVGKHFEQYRPE